MGIPALCSASAGISLLGRCSKATMRLHAWPPLTGEVEGCDMVMARVLSLPGLPDTTVTVLGDTVFLPVGYTNPDSSWGLHQHQRGEGGSSLLSLL